MQSAILEQKEDSGKIGKNSIKVWSLAENTVAKLTSYSWSLYLVRGDITAGEGGERHKGTHPTILAGFLQV